MHAFLDRFRSSKNEIVYGPEHPLPAPVACFTQSYADGSVGIGDEDGTYFYDYQPCKIMSAVNVVRFGEEYKEFVVVYNDKNGKEHRFRTRLNDDHLVKNEILVREFETLFKEYEEAVNKAQSLATVLGLIERYLRQSSITEEEVACLVCSTHH